ncbi:MAG: hypothetical protein HZA01_14790 [Nitrospinae bacterium]|nr:hypothetical protein [Nitrospinota bacterium]
MKNPLLHVSTILILAWVLPALFLLSSCILRHNKAADKLDKEMDNLSWYINSKILGELKGDISELRNKNNEANVNIDVFEKKIQHFKLQADNLENEYRHLSLKMKEAGHGGNDLEQLKSIRREIMELEEELNQMKNGKDIRIWRQ